MVRVVPIASGACSQWPDRIKMALGRGKRSAQAFFSAFQASSKSE